MADNNKKKKEQNGSKNCGSERRSFKDCTLYILFLIPSVAKGFIAVMPRWERAI